MNDLRISLVQTRLHWENAAANRAMLETKLAGLEGQTDLIILPEMFSTGFTMKPEQLADNVRIFSSRQFGRRLHL